MNIVVAQYEIVSNCFYFSSFSYIYLFLCGLKDNGLYLFYTWDTQRHYTEVDWGGRERERKKYPKHDSRESAENETIEMRINSPQLPVSNWNFFTIKICTHTQRQRDPSISKVISETVMDVKLENHLFMSNLLKRSQAIAKPFESQRCSMQLRDIL